MSAHGSGVQAGEQLEGLLQLVKGPLVELRLAYPIEYLLVGGVDADVQLGWERVKVLYHLGEASVSD